MMPQPSMLILLVVTSAMTLMPASAQDGPMQTASPAISDKVSSFERAARVNNAGFSSTATGRHVNSFDPAAATLAWLDSVPRNQREKSDAYFEGGYWLILWNFLLAAAISVFLLAHGFPRDCVIFPNVLQRSRISKSSAMRSHICFSFTH